MTVYSIIVFLHVVAALALFAAIGLEWTGLLNLRRATSLAQAREWSKPLKSVGSIGFPAMLTLLITGIYMTTTRWGEQSWIVMSMGVWLIIVLLGGGVTGRRTGRIARELATETGGISPALAALLGDPVLVFSLYMRTALALGIVFLMTTKPTSVIAAVAVGLAAAIGLAAGLPKRARARTTGSLAPKTETTELQRTPR